MPNSLIIRPLIECSRAQVEAYCAAHGLAYRTDSSNFDLSFRRNQIRREVLPPLQLNDGVMRRMFRALEADEAFLQSAARNAQPTAGELPEALQTRLLREQLVLAKREPTQARMAALRQTGARRAVAPARNISVKLEWADWNQHENFTNQGLANRLDCDTIRGSLVIGRRAPGDRMRMVNGAGTKPLKKLFQERGVPPEERGQPVVLRDDAGVVWIEGFGCAHRCRITDKTKKTLRIIIQEG
jgi:tRNA(Ile)-lysidine synthase